MRRWAGPRIAVVVTGAVVFLAATAGSAAAHTISGPRPTNYRSRVVAIAPPAPGLSARVVDLGANIELTNSGSTEIVVLGYVGEQYLRVGPAGVFENLRSQATYINRTRAGGVVPPDIDTSPTAVPEWKKISDGHTARWHDHRIHWMGAQEPPPVAESPGTFHHLSQQNIVVLRDGQRIGIAVSLDWVPGPSGLPWIPVLVLLFAVGALVALLPKPWRVLATLIGLVVVFDIAHAIAYEIPRAGGTTTKLLQFLGGSFVSIAVWIAAVPTVIAVLRRRVDALYGVVFVALMVALVGGATDLSALWKSQLPDAGPAWLTRVEVAVALGLGGGLVVGALVRMLRSRTTAGDDGRGRWLSLLVAGLSDAELARIVRELDVDEVLKVALRELATRAEPATDVFANGSVVFVVTDHDVPVEWSVVRADGASPALRSARGRVVPTAVEIRAPFAVMLQLLAGSVLVDDAVARSSITATGDAALVAQLAHYLPETASITPVDDPGSAS